MSNPALVLLHAFPVDARMWDGMRDGLAARTRVITPDQRGLGRSPLPESSREPDLDDAARDVLALLDKLELDRVVLGGCSMGGYLTMAVLRAAPQAEADIFERLKRRDLQVDRAPSLRFVLNWETDANDVDFHIFDGRGGHAYYMQPRLPSGGALYADITTGYGPECFAIPGRARAYPYTLRAHYFARGPMGGLPAIRRPSKDHRR
jgi:pimeloyl-ACP methyl ester carboxylesterase